VFWAPFLLAMGPGLIVSTAVYLAARWPAPPPPPQEAAAAPPPGAGALPPPLDGAVSAAP